MKSTSIGLNKRKREKVQMPLKESLLRKQAFRSEISNESRPSNAENDRKPILETCNNETTFSASQPELGEFDDSFDLFLPKKAPQKPSSSQSSFFEVKKKSRYFNNSGKLKIPKVVKDDDLELALAISLEESEGKQVSLTPCPSTLPTKGKTKKKYSQSLLMKRTLAERERIITEKVAIVLMETSKNIAPSLISYRRFRSSALKKYHDEAATLWTMSQSDLSQMAKEKLLVAIMLQYGKPEKLLASNSQKWDESENLQRALSSEDIFGDSCIEDGELKAHSPKRIRLSEKSPKQMNIHDPTFNLVSQFSLERPHSTTKDVSNQFSEEESNTNFVNCINRLCKPLSLSSLSRDSSEHSTNAICSLQTETNALCSLTGPENDDHNVVNNLLSTPLGSTQTQVNVDINHSPKSAISLCSQSMDNHSFSTVRNQSQEMVEVLSPSRNPLPEDETNSRCTITISTGSSSIQTMDEADPIGISVSSKNKLFGMRIEQTDLLGQNDDNFDSFTRSVEKIGIAEQESLNGTNCSPEKPSPSRLIDCMKHFRKLSSDMLSLHSNKCEKVIEVKKSDRSYYIHSSIFSARCPLLWTKLENDVGYLNKYSCDVVNALIKYVYAADIQDCLLLNSNEIDQLIRISREYDLKLLYEDLLVQRSISNKESINLSGKIRNVAQSSETGVSPLEVTELSKSPNVLTSPAEWNGVVVLDSDSCSPIHEMTRYSMPDYYKATSEDQDLDLYRKEGICISDRNVFSFKRESHREKEGLSSRPILDVSVNSKPAKNSTDRYFEDSFPSLDTPKTHNIEEMPPEPTPGPSNRFNIINCLTPCGKLVVSEEATPCPEYETLPSPELQNELEKYGIKKGVSRKKAATLLRYIYDQIHPEADHPAVTKAINDVMEFRTKTIEAQLDSDSDVYSLSSNSSEEQEYFEELGDVAGKEQTRSAEEKNNRPDLLQRIGGFIKSNKILYTAVLKYEPIWINKLSKTLKEHGIQCNMKQLVPVLDELGVTFRTEKPEKRMNRIKKRKRCIRKS